LKSQAGTKSISAAAQTGNQPCHQTNRSRPPYSATTRGTRGPSRPRGIPPELAESAATIPS